MSVLLFLRSKHIQTEIHIHTFICEDLNLHYVAGTFGRNDILPQSTQINCNLGLSVWLRYTSACLQEEPEIKSPMICNVMLLPQVQFVTNMTDYKSQPEFSTFYVDVPEIL